MKAMGFSETFGAAIETSLLAELGTGLVEIAAVELAILPLILFGKVMKNHHDKKKTER